MGMLNVDPRMTRKALHDVGYDALSTCAHDRPSASATTVIEAEECVDTGPSPAGTPLRNHVFRSLFIAQFVSNVGTWMQSVAAQWFLVEDHSSAVIVALVQTASLGPTLFLGLF